MPLDDEKRQALGDPGFVKMREQQELERAVSDTQWLRERGISPGAEPGEWKPMGMGERFGQMMAGTPEAQRQQGRFFGKLPEAYAQRAQEMMPLGDIPIRDKKGKVVEWVPREEYERRFTKPFDPVEEGSADLLLQAAQILEPGPGGEVKKLAGVFGPHISHGLRGAAGAWLTKARPSIYKKGTRLGDLFRKIGYAPGKEASVIASADPTVPLIGSTASGAAVNIGIKDKATQDVAATMHILGHENAHIFYRRLKALGKHDPEAKAIADLLEDAAMASTGFRRPGSVMQSSVASAEYGLPFREAERMTLTSPGTLSQVDRPHPGGGPAGRAFGQRMSVREEMLKGDPSLVREEFMLPASLAEEAGDEAAKRLNERVADLLSEATSFKGQQGWNPKQREFMSAIMDLYR